MTTQPDEITFARPFRLPGMEQDHAPGTFRLSIEQIQLDVPWPAHRTSITILLPNGNAVESWAVTQSDLDAAMLRDQATAGRRYP